MSQLNTENSTALDTWLKRATCGLSNASASLVRSEIQQHYESAEDASLSEGATAEEAGRLAVASLGDAKSANRQYRRVLLTSPEARLLRETKWEARALCSRPGLRWLLLIPLAGLCASIWFFNSGETWLAWMLLVGMIGLAALPSALVLPIYTPARGRLYRYARWAWLAAIVALSSWPDGRALSWLLPCMWPIVSVEWMLFSLRRKLPVGEWPKQLYL